MSNPRVFLFIGMSGCGKSTQAKLVCDYLVANDKEHKTLYIYVGDTMRELMKRTDSYTLRLANEIMAQGKIQPNFLAVHAWSHVLIDDFQENMNLVMDGSPRTLLEARVLDDTFAFYNLKVTPVHIKVGESWVRQRMKERGRFDDTDDKIKNRLAFFKDSVQPALDYYSLESKNKLITINGEQGVEEVHGEVLQKVLGV